MKRSIITIVENLASKATVRIISDAGSEIWMSKPEIAHLLMVYQNTISNNLRAIFKAGILNEKDAIREHRYKSRTQNVLQFIIVWKLLLHYVTVSVHFQHKQSDNTLKVKLNSRITMKQHLTNFINYPFSH